MNYTFGIISKKPLPNLRSSRISTMLTSRSFIVFHFTFKNKSIGHFQLISVKGIRLMSTFFFFLVVECPHAFSTIDFQDYFSSLNCLCSSVKDQLTIFV